MGDGRPPHPKRRRGPAGRTFALALLGLLAAGGPAPADLRPPARMRGEPPMRFVRVVSAEPGMRAQLPGMAFGRGPDRARRGDRPRRSAREAQRPPIADPHPFSRRLGRRRDGDGRAHSSQGPRGRRRQDADHELSRAGAEMPERPGQGDHRRRNVRLGLRARARRRRRAARRPRGAGRRASDHHGGERDRGRGASHLDAEGLRAAGRRRRGQRLSRRDGRRRSGDGAHAQDAGGQRSLAEPRRSQGLASRDIGARRRRADRDQRRERPQRPGVRRRPAAGRSRTGERRHADRWTRRDARHRVPLSARRRRGRSGDDGERCRDATGIRAARRRTGA